MNDGDSADLQKEIKKDIKIVLVGLDYAGKSSMLIVIRKIYQFLKDLTKLQPTIRIDYYNQDFLGYNVHFWDFGGQEKYRARYLQRSIYFENIDSLIYLIDIQDPNRFDESLSYLADIISVLNEVEYDKMNPIMICFSKMDYDAVFSEHPEYIVRIAQLRKRINERFPEFKFDYYSTSIFNPYSIIKMISNALNRNIPGFKRLYEKLAEFSERFDFDRVILFEDSGLMLAEYMNSLKDFPQKEYDKVISEHLEFYRRMEDEKDTSFRYSKKSHGQFTDVCMRFPLYPDGDGKSNRNFYLSLLMDNNRALEAKWDRNEIINDLRVIIREIIEKR